MSSLAPPSPVTEQLAIEIAEPVVVCASCEQPLAGEWCHQCGERRHAEERLSAGHFLRELADDVVGVDSRAVQTLRLLVLHPGELTLEFLRGRRRPYVGPLKLYLVIFAITLFISQLIPDGTTVPARKDGAISVLYARLVHQLALRKGVTDQVARRALEQSTAQHVSWLSLLIPLIFATSLYLVFRRRRRWFGEHLVFATHFATFNFLVGLMLIPIQLLLIGRGELATLAISVAALIPLFAYAMISVRRVYVTGWPGATGGALLLFLTLSLAQLITGALALCTAALAITWFGV